jgi:hypothetical protein
MKLLSDNQQKNTSLAAANGQGSSMELSGDNVRLPDSSQQHIIQNKLQGIANNSPQVAKGGQLQVMANQYITGKQPVQKKENKTGLPDQLKSGIEHISGMSIDDVRVHFNSEKPAQLQAFAFAQGNEIHVASGQEKHLAHEAWHVVQQKQGRVRQTRQLKSGTGINDDPELEKEADIKGMEALQMFRTESPVAETDNSETVKAFSLPNKSISNVTSATAQRTIQLNRKKGLVDQHHDIPIDSDGTPVVTPGSRNSTAAKFINRLINNGTLESTSSQFIGGHLLKAEYGGYDSPSNVVPWSSSMEAAYGRFESSYREHMKRHANWWWSHYGEYIDASDGNKVKKGPGWSFLKRESPWLAFDKKPGPGEVMTNYHLNVSTLFKDWKKSDFDIATGVPELTIKRVLNVMEDVPYSVSAMGQNSFSVYETWDQDQITNGKLKIKNPVRNEVEEGEGEGEGQRSRLTLNESDIEPAQALLAQIADLLGDRVMELRAAVSEHRSVEGLRGDLAEIIARVRLDKIYQTEIVPAVAEELRENPDDIRTFTIGNIECLKKIEGYTGILDFQNKIVARYGYTDYRSYRENQDHDIRAEWMLESLKGCREADNQLWKSCGELDAAVCLTYKEGKPAIIELQQVKSGQNDVGALADKQNLNTLDIIKKIGAGDKNYAMYQRIGHNTLGRNVSDDYDLTHINDTLLTTIGPKQKTQAGFTENLDFTTEQLTKVATLLLIRKD